MEEKSKSRVEAAPRAVTIIRTINAPRELVFDAFTRAEHLTHWFGPHGFGASAVCEPHIGGKYEIVMHGTSGLPEPFASGDFPMKGTFTEFTPPERIAYSVDLSGHPQFWKDLLRSHIPNAENENYLTGFVTITFEDAHGKTKLTIRSTFSSDAVRDGYRKLGMAEGWELSFQKLDDYVSGTVIVERTFHASIERVWNAITNIDAMKRWYFELKEFRPEVGFEFRFEGGPPDKEPYLHVCTIIEVTPMKKLCHTWSYEGWKGKTTVCWELIAEGPNTLLRLTHSGLESFAPNHNPDLEAHNFEAGWNDIVGRSLKEFVESHG